MWLPAPYMFRLPTIIRRGVVLNSNDIALALECEKADSAVRFGQAGLFGSHLYLQ
jgi:hypothetical protein